MKTKLDPESATERIRATLKVYAVKNHLGPIARDAGTNPSSLEEFVKGGTLPVAVLDALAKRLFDGSFGPAIDRMRRVNRRNRPRCALPAISNRCGMI